jgi:serine/threonine protein kinase/TolB-like protein/Flp pilus assembly protein TadD
MIGRTLSHYRITAKLGEGGMGAVYRAEDTTLGRDVALKVLPTEMARDPERLARFEQEARTLAALDHPNIVHIYSVESSPAKDGEVRFLTMQLVEGRRLSDLIRPGGMPLDRLFDLALPLAEALAGAHEKGVIHRDLKPANVMVTEDGRVKVLDFGLAKLRQMAPAPEKTEVTAEPLTGENRVLGTMPYMSPEQLEGGDLDARSDIFSLGTVLYEMATGQRPFRGDSSITLISSIVKDTPPSVDALRQDVPHHLARIVNRCLEKIPKRRYQLALDVYNDLDVLRREIEAGVVSSGPEQLTSAERQATRPSRTRSWLSAAGVLGLVAVAVAWLTWPGRPDEGSPGTPGESVAAVEAESPMIVVLPFQNRGAPEDEYFCDGMTDEITTRLAGVSGLRVISSSSAMQYKKDRPPMKQIAEELGVDYVLDGSVRWARGDSGSRVRITPQLVRTDDDTQVWAGSYDRVIEDVFAIQTEIASEVVAQLGVALHEPEREGLESRPTGSLEAYQAYLRGNYRVGLADFTEENQRRAIESYRHATELDPDFALAWAGLAHTHSFYYRLGFDLTEKRREMARQAFDRALALDPDSPRVLFETAFYHYYVEQDFDAALEKFLAASAALPSDADILAAAAYVWRRQGRFKEGIERLERAFELDPRNSQHPALIGEYAQQMRDYARSVEYFDTAIALAPEVYWPFVQKAETVCLWTGDVDEAQRILEAAPHSARGTVSLVLHQSTLARMRRDFDGVIGLQETAPFEWYDDQHVSQPKGLLTAEALQLKGDDRAAREAFEAARAALETALEKRPDDYRARASLGLALAGLGRKADAIAAGRKAVDMQPVEEEAYIGPPLLERLALIYTRVGESDLAIDTIDRLLSIPAKISVAELRLDPRWDPLRDQPRFQKLLDSYS